MKTDLKPNDESAVREEWSDAIAKLYQNIREWAEAEGWHVSEVARTFVEPSTGSYVAPNIVIDTPEGNRLVIEVKGRGAANANGRVQLSAWPSLFRVLLLHKPGEENWTIRTDSGIPLRRPWGRETFLEVAKDLLGADQ